MPSSNHLNINIKSQDRETLAISAAQTRFLEMIKSGDELAVAWDRDSCVLGAISQAESALPRLYETNLVSHSNYSASVWIGNGSTDRVVLRWTADKSNPLGGSWVVDKR